MVMFREWLASSSLRRSQQISNQNRSVSSSRTKSQEPNNDLAEIVDSRNQPRKIPDSRTTAANTKRMSRLIND